MRCSYCVTPRRILNLFDNIVAFMHHIASYAIVDLLFIRYLFCLIFFLILASFYLRYTLTSSCHFTIADNESSWRRFVHAGLRGHVITLSFIIYYYFFPIGFHMEITEKLERTD